MGYTVIRYRDRSFVANDVPIDVWLLEVIHAIESSGEKDTWQAELIEDWRLQATSGFGFGPVPKLDRHLSSDDRRRQMERYFGSALESLANRQGYSPDELTRAGIDGPTAMFAADLPAQAVVEVGKQFLALIS